ncbi:hypothetical protein [Chitinophaga qingshengii]|uniref:YD repeat-containing protein n=1 Tax=Chitinophaga qingshengii TaxID=1569794 RepID=A0ABR7TJE4_9BACT|nr:hypothetical protein [Chitinophaga qingshengii]MBC9929651.1 hypothetical protein [Chitinophaga qingshengii]
MIHRLKTQLATCALLAVSMTFATAFRTDNNAPGATYLSKISSPAGKTTFEYNADKTLRKITRLHQSGRDSWLSIQLPVYENGRLVKTFSTDDANAVTGDLNATYSYTANGQLQFINYYRNNAVYMTDSLVYNATGKISARYHQTINPVKRQLEITGYQEYTWNKDGDVTQMDNYGKVPGYSSFQLTSSATYTYDRQQNPQQLCPELAYLTDITPANMSTHNVLSESVNGARTSQAYTHTFTYAYNASKFPVKGTFRNGMDEGTVKLEWTKL